MSTNKLFSTLNLLFTIVVFLGLSIETLSAATIDFDGDVDSDWNNPLNWVGDVLPGSGDDVDLDGKTVVLTGNTTVQRVYAGGSSNLTVNNGVTLTLDGFSGDDGLEIQGSATVTNNGTITVSNIAGGASDGIYVKGVLINNGAITIDNIGDHGIYVQGGTFTNNAAGTVNVGTVGVTSTDSNGSPDGDGILVDDNSGTGGTFNNFGAVAVTMDDGDDAMYVNDASRFNNENGGTITISGSNHDDGIRVDDKAILENKSGGTITINTVGDDQLFLDNDGTVNNTGTINLNNSNDHALYVTDDGVFTNNATGMINIASASDISIRIEANSGTPELKNSGTITITGATTGVKAEEGGIFTNTSTGVLNVTSNSSDGIRGDDGVYNNDGTIHMNNAGGEEIETDGATFMNTANAMYSVGGIGTIGDFEIKDNFDFGASSITFDINSSGNDQIKNFDNTVAMNIGGATAHLNWGTYIPAVGDCFKIVDGSGAVTSAFSAITTSNSGIAVSYSNADAAEIELCVDAVCIPPTGLAISGITNTTGNLSWTAVTGATGYNWKVVAAGAGSGAAAVASGSASGTTATATGLSSTTSYDLYVQTDCGGGDLSEFSSAYTFMTSAATSCTVPSNLGATNLTTTSADLNWDAASGASGYNWKVVEADAGSGATAVAMGSTTTATSATATGLSCETSYDLYVQTDCGGGDLSEFSTAYNFMTSAPTSCAVPSNLSATNLTATSADLSWDAIDCGGTGYNWKVVEAGAGSGATAVAMGSTTTATSATATGLSCETSYDLYVQTDCGGDDLSEFSTAYNFMTSVASQITTTIGTSTSSSSSEGPTHAKQSATTRYSRFNQVFTQSELLAAGLTASASISELQWYLNSTTTVNSGNANFKIYIRNSSATAATEDTWTNLTTGSTLAVNRILNTTNNFPGVTGWMPFTFDAPFIYTGGALEVAVEWDWAGATLIDGTDSDPQIKWRTEDYAPTNVVVRGLSSSGPKEDLTLSTSSSNLPSERANIQFIHTPSCTSCDVPTLSVTDMAMTTVDFSWNGVSDATSYNWVLVEAGAGVGGTVVASGTTSSTSASASGLLCLNGYDLYIQADCGSGLLSEFSAATRVLTLPETELSTLTIGTGTSSSSSEGPTHAKTTASTRYARFNHVFLKSELSSITTNNTITELQWYLNSTTTINTGSATFKIYIRNSSATEATADTWTALTTGSALVYDGIFNTTNNFPGEKGWMPFTLTTPFIYTGDALEIAVEWDWSGATLIDGTDSDPQIKWRTQDYAPTNVVVRGLSSSGPKEDLTLSTSSSNLPSERANIQIVHAPACVPLCEGTGLIANASMDTYDLIRSVLGPDGEPSETPDCGHTAFGDHITQQNDADLGKDVFAFHIHVNEDNDRCINFDRQRNEIKTYNPSPDNLKGVLGETVQYKWKFKLPAGFQSSAKFTHIHQLKSVGASDNEDSMPQITFTTRKGVNGNPDQLELRYAEDFSQITWAQTDLTPFKGAWVEVIETVTYGDWGEGEYAVDIKKISDGSTLLTYSNNATRMWKTDASFIRPKWGIYRSLEDAVDLRDETVCFADFCIEETATATSCAAVTTYLNAKDITASTAELSWGGVPGAINYNWKVVLAGAGATGAAVAEGTSPKTAILVSSLNPTTFYDLHVEADCGASITTGFSAAYNFMTTEMTDEVCADQIGTETNSSSSRGPIHQGGATTSSTRYSRFFQVFTQAELAAIGLAANNEITELSWFITTTDVIDELGDAPFKIYIKNSTATVASENTWAALTSGATLALDTELNATNNFPGAAGWMPFTLDAPFVYTGGALEIAVEWNWASVVFTNGGTVKWQYSNFANDVMVRALGSTEHSNNLTKSSTSKQRANIQICYTPGVPPSCPAPSNLNATNITINSADLSWEAVSSASSYNWKVVGLGAGADATAIASGSTAGLTASATNLSCLTAYDLHVQADCGGGDLSTFSKAHTFVTLPGVTPATTTIGTETSSSSSRGPIQQGGGNSTTRYSRFNQVFTQTELLAAGLTANSSITEIQWYLNSTEKIAGSGDAPMKVYIKNSTATEATAIAWSAAIAGSTMVVDRVFNTTKNFPGVTGWMPFTFNTPFVYTGGGLEIAVEWDFGSISIPAFTGSDESNPNGQSIKWRYSSYANNVVVRLLGSGSHGTSNLSFAKDSEPKDRANIQFITVPESSCPTCVISNLTASTCPDGVLTELNTTTGLMETVTETITVQDANNPTCLASIEVPVCADGSSVDITFTTTRGGAASTTFNLFVDGALKAAGGTQTGSGSSDFAFNNIITPASGAAGGVTPTGTPEMSIKDPCNCDNPENIRNNIGQVTHFHDILTVSTGAAGQTIVLASGSNAFLNTSLAQVGDNVVLGTTNASGVLETEFFHADKVSGTITILNQTTGISESFFIPGCVYGECTPIPTMSEWGLLIFGLLIMNLSIFFVQRRELI